MKLHRIARGFLVLALGAGLLGFSAPSTASANGPVFEPANLVLRQVIQDTIFGPLGIANAGDGSGRLFLLDQSGKIRIVKNGVLLPTPFLDITTLLSFTLGGEQGLLGLAFHPNYDITRQFYVAYTAAGTGALTLARYLAQAGNPDLADPASGIVLLSIPHPTHTNHNGGTLAFGPNDGWLYWTTGDGGGGDDPDDNAQDLGSLLGKVLRLDVDNPGAGMQYGIPPGNPFVESPVDDPATLAEIWAYGLRNPWRASFDRQTFDFWIGDVGQDDWEEIDFQPAASTGGENYGWDVMEGAHCNEGTTCTEPADYVPPVAEYLNPAAGCAAIIGGYRYRGARYPLVQGQYFYGDECSGALYTINPTTTSWTPTLLPITLPVLSSFGEDESGEIYLTDWGNGKIYKFCYIAGAQTCAPDTVGIYSGNTFFLRNSNTSGVADLAFPFGWAGPAPIVGDWDGNGTATVGIDDGGWFFLRNSNSAGPADIVFQYGWDGAVPLMGDWDGNGTTTAGIYSDGWFFLRNSNSPGPADLVFSFGWAGATPLVGDWDGNGTTTVGIYSGGNFFLRNSNAPGAADLAFGYGPAGAVPVVGDWDGNDTTTVGIYITDTFFLRNSNTPGPANLTFGYGFAGAAPLGGDWNGIP